MSELDAIAAHRKALERVIEVRKARLKTRKQMLKSELHTRLTPQGIASRFPLTTLLVGFSVGWFAGRTFRALITPQTPYTPQRQSPPNRTRTSSPVIQTLKEIAFQTLTNFALNKTREILVNHLNTSQRVQNNIANISNPSSVKP
jgi:hypothetical protein